MEKRFNLVADAEIRVGTNPRGLIGYSATFGRAARIGDFSETIMPGAFKRSLSDGHDVLGLANHEPAHVLARTGAGSLRLAEDSKGLHFEIPTLPDTSYARDILELVRSGNAGGCSFAFTLPPGGDHWEGRSRSLLDVNLHEISVISGTPAYSDTTVAARSQTEWREAAPGEWIVGADRDLPIDDATGWDGPAAAERMLAAAGFNGNSPDPGRARRGFLAYDHHNPGLKGSYKLPFADVISGDLRAVRGGIDAAARRLDQTDIPPDVRAAAKRVLDAYEARMSGDRAARLRRMTILGV